MKLGSKYVSHGPLVVHWLTIHCAVQGTWVWFLVGELIIPPAGEQPQLLSPLPLESAPQLESPSARTRECVHHNGRAPATIATRHRHTNRRASCSVVSTSLPPHGLYCRAPLSMGVSRQEYWSGLPMPFSRGASWLRDRTRVSCVASRFFTVWATRED